MEAITGTRARRVLSDDVYEGIRELLFDQNFAPGERLVIDQLATRLGVSPTPVREALARLEADRLVVKEAHKGYSVAPMLDSQSFLALYEMRLVIEPAAARLAAERAERAQISAMSIAVAKMVAIAEKTKDAETAVQYREYGPIPELDGSFHEAIAKASGNPFLFEALARLRPQQQTARLYSKRGVPDLALAVAEHQSILEAIDAGNPEDAAQRMREHLIRARTFLFSILNPDPSP
jgi:DNA-binding GntR family transcriptional regulator